MILECVDLQSIPLNTSWHIFTPFKSKEKDQFHDDLSCGCTGDFFTCYCAAERIFFQNNFNFDCSKLSVWNHRPKIHIEGFKHWN